MDKKNDVIGQTDTPLSGQDAAQDDTRPGIDEETNIVIENDPDLFETQEIIDRIGTANIRSLPAIKELCKAHSGLPSSEFIPRVREALEHDPHVSALPWKEQWITSVMQGLVSENGPAVFMTKGQGEHIFVNQNNIIGSGGQGSVSEVFHSQFPDADAVIKLTPPLIPELQGVETIKARSEREVDILKSLKGVQGVPTLLDHGTVSHPHRIFFIQERVEGVGFDKVLEKAGRLSPDAVKVLLLRTATVMRDIAAKGVYHRDIKGSNLLVELETGNPFVIDYGLATDKDSGNREDLTRSNVGLGTRGFMTAELMNPKHEATESTDMNQLARVAYLSITGSSFLSDQEEQRMLYGYGLKDDNNRIPPEFDVDVHGKMIQSGLWKHDPELAAVLELMLQTHKVDRPQSWHQLLHDGGDLTFETSEGEKTVVHTKPLTTVVSEDLVQKWPTFTEQELKEQVSQSDRARELGKMLRKTYSGAISASEIDPSQLSSAQSLPQYERPTTALQEELSPRKQHTIRNRILGYGTAASLAVAALLYATKKVEPTIETQPNGPTPTIPDPGVERPDPNPLPHGAKKYPGFNEVRIERKGELPNYTYALPNGEETGDWFIWYNKDLMEAHNGNWGELLYVHCGRFDKNTEKKPIFGYSSPGARSFGEGDTHAVIVPVSKYDIRDYQREVGTDDTEYPEGRSNLALVNIGDHVLMYVVGEEGYVYLYVHPDAYKNPNSALVFENLEDFQAFLSSEGITEELEEKRDVLTSQVRGRGKSTKEEKGGAKIFHIEYDSVNEGEDAAIGSLNDALDHILTPAETESPEQSQ